jgi:hypothetical protein
VSLLVDVCRQCIVFHEGGDLVRCLRAMSSDPEVAVVRVKNRLDPHYNVRSSAGYRDVLVNLRIETAQTGELCAAGHVCEVQLLLLPFAQIKVNPPTARARIQDSSDGSLCFGPTFGCSSIGQGTRRAVLSHTHTLYPVGLGGCSQWHHPSASCREHWRASPQGQGRQAACPGASHARAVHVCRDRGQGCLNEGKGAVSAFNLIQRQCKGYFAVPAFSPFSVGSRSSTP